MFGIVNFTYNLPKRFDNTVKQTYAISRHWNDKKILNTIDITVKHLDRNRYRIWEDSYQKWKPTPWMGIGMGNYAFLQKFGKGLNLHSFIYGVLVEQGIIGLFLLITTYDN